MSTLPSDPLFDSTMTLDGIDSRTSLVEKSGTRTQHIITNLEKNQKLGGRQQPRLTLSESQDYEDRPLPQTDEKEEEEHPLFMIGLPSSFLANRGLAAIASLIENEGNPTSSTETTNVNNYYNDEKRLGLPMEEGTLGVIGGGKIPRPTKTCTKLVSCPYNIPKRLTKVEKKTTVSEAQVYLNLWKI
jgi:hypothetical protein